MPNYIKRNLTSNDPGSLFKDQVALGVNTGSVLGPTSTTGWYTGVTPNTNKFIIYQVFDSGDPDIFAPSTDQELFNLVKMKGGSAADYASVSASLAWFNIQPTLISTNFEYENIVTDGLVFHADAGFVGSLPQTGSKWYDLSGKNNNGAFTSGLTNIFPTWTPANSGSLSFTGTTNPSRIVCGNSSSLQISTGSISAWVKLPNDPAASIRGIIVKQQAWGLFVDQNYLVAYDWTGPQSIVTNAIIGNNTWCYITLTFDGIINGGGNIYLNAVNVNPFDFNIYVNNQTQPLVLGAGANSNTQLLSGNIAIASVYNRILSPTEIEQNFNAQRARFGV